jgi:hypothetical protein
MTRRAGPPVSQAAPHFCIPVFREDGGDHNPAAHSPDFIFMSGCMTSCREFEGQVKRRGRVRKRHSMKQRLMESFLT